MRLLTVLLYVPGRKVLQQLLPLALGGGSLWAAQGYCSAKADSNSAHVGLDSKAGAQPALAPTVQPSKAEQPGGTLPNLMAKLMGSNEFANVSCNAPTMHCTLTLQLTAWRCCAGPHGVNSCSADALACQVTPAALLPFHLPVEALSRAALWSEMPPLLCMLF